VRTVGQLAAGGSGGQKISLRQGEYEIEQIVVTNRKSRLARLGHTGILVRANQEAILLADSLLADGKNREEGIAIKVRRDSEILSFGVNLYRNVYERVLFRLSFYSFENGTPGELVVHKDVKFEVRDGFEGLFKVDLTPYDIRFAKGENIFVALTVLEDEMESGTAELSMYWRNSLSRSEYYYRNIGDEIWKRTGHSYPMYLDVREYR
jgi:hypothetical protein